MGCFENIQSKINLPDNSRELKSGEIKSILIQVFSESITEFKYERYQNGCYYFTRIRDYKSYMLYETFHVLYSLKERHFACSISSCFNKDYIYQNQYNKCPLNIHIDLLTLVKGIGVISVDEAYYFHNGKLDNTTKVVKQIVLDYKKYGLRFLEERFSLISCNTYLNAGFDYIAHLSVDPILLKESLGEELKKAKYFVKRIRHPEYIRLEDMLLKMKGGTRESRKGIPKLSYELLEFYCVTTY